MSWGYFTIGLYDRTRTSLIIHACRHETRLMQCKSSVRITQKFCCSFIRYYGIAVKLCIISATNNKCHFFLKSSNFLLNYKEELEKLYCISTITFATIKKTTLQQSFDKIRVLIYIMPALPILLLAPQPCKTVSVQFASNSTVGSEVLLCDCF